MLAETKQKRVSNLRTRAVPGFSAFLAAVILTGHYNPLGPKISPGEREGVGRFSPCESVTASHLAPVEAAGALLSVIPEGCRWITVRVDDVVGVSGPVMSGSLFDVVVLTSLTKRGGREERISNIVLQNIKVIATSQKVDKSKKDREGERSTMAVTLQVTPAQAEKLVIASTEGKLKLVNRRLTN
jgi:Flp pilus assembly protein CpaB